MGLHSHNIEIGGDVVVLSASSGLGHVHAGDHPLLGGSFVTKPADDIFTHRHTVVTDDERHIQTSIETDVDPGASAEPRVTSKSVIPEVLTMEAVRSGEIPEEGSGIPESLEKSIPGRFHYWKAERSDRLAVRRALVESGLVTESTVRKVSYNGGPPSLMLVRAVEGSPDLFAPVLEDKNEPVVPSFPPDIEIAAKAAGVEGRLVGADSVEALSTLGGVGATELFKSLLASGGEWMVQLRVGSEGAVAVAKRYDACTAFLLPHSDAHIYYGSGVPETGVRFMADPDPVVKTELETRRNLSPESILIAGEDPDLTEYQKDLALATAGLARKSEWSDFDLRVATRLRVLSESELARPQEDRRAGLLKAMGIDVDGPAHEVLAKADTIRIRKFASGTRQPTERLVFGVVLEPGTGDLHHDITTEESIRAAYYNYIEVHGHVGLQHEMLIKGWTRLTMTYLAPCDFIPEGCDESEMIRKGSWVQEERVLNDDHWSDILAGKYTGYSIGGHGRRLPLE